MNKIKIDNIKKCKRRLKRKKCIPTHIVCNKKRCLELKKFKEYDEQTNTLLGLKFKVWKYCSSDYIYIMDYSKYGYVKEYGNY